jgi:archaellum biogenesis ATPase FlaH
MTTAAPAMAGLCDPASYVLLDALPPLPHAFLANAGKQTQANDHDLDLSDVEAGFRPEPDWARIKSALTAIPVEARDDREIWRNVGFALKDHCLGSDEEAAALWNEWSSASPKFDAGDQARTWRGLGKRIGPRIGIGTLFDLARRHGWTGKPRAAPSRLTFLSPEECAAAPSRLYLIKGILAAGDIAVIFGAPGAGKSLLAPHIGYQLSIGRPAFGMRTRKGLVFYVAAEDPHGMRARISALKLAYGHVEGFMLVEGVSDLLTKDSPDLAALLAAVEEKQPALIIIDTLAMAFPGLEENSAEGMGRVVAVARSLATSGAAVILIHHDTKAEGVTPRGHSLLNGAVDMGLHLKARDDQGIVRGKLTKNRNGAIDRDIAFRISVRELGHDEDGDPITAALVLELEPGATPRRERLTAAESAALKVLSSLPGIDGRVIEETWRDACIDGHAVSASETRDNRRRATTRAIEGLVRKSAIAISGGLVFRAGSGAALSVDLE